MQLDLTHIWAHMGGLSRGIAACLMFMAIASIGVIVERLIAFAKADKASKNFALAARPLLERWDIEGIVPTAQKFKASPLASLFERMTAKYLDGVQSPGNMTPIELARNESIRRLDTLGSELRRGMSVLASVGSVAPFVGLLGTVVGIMGAFAGIGAAGSAGMGAVMSGISEALVETAFGLMVAIPAVLFYNYLSTRVANIELALTRSVGELLDEMENNHGQPAKKRVEKAA